MAMDRAPGLDRSFAFEAWPGHDKGGLGALREELRARVKPLGKRVIWGGDSDRKMVEAAEHNLERAGLADQVRLEVCNARSFSPRHGWNAQVITNPPFGERVSDERRLVKVYEDFGEALREHAQGFRVSLLSGSLNLEHCLGMPKPTSWMDIKNGALDCRLLNWQL